MWFLPAKNAAVLTAANILYANMVISNIWQLKTTLSLSWPIFIYGQQWLWASRVFSELPLAVLLSQQEFDISASRISSLLLYQLWNNKLWWGFSRADRLLLFLLHGYFGSFKPKKSSVINLSVHSSVQHDLNFNYLFYCLVYHEAHLPNNRTWRESWAFASSQLWWLFSLEQAAAKWWCHSNLIWGSKPCVKHGLKYANLTARLAQCIL